MRRLSLFLVAGLLAGGCAGVKPDAPPPAVTFEALSKRYLDEFTRYAPVAATGLGDHRWDAELDDVSAAGRAAAREFNERTLDALEDIDRDGLARAQQVDWLLLRQRLRYAIWQETKLRDWSWDVVGYRQLAGGAIYSLMAREFAPLPERLRAAAARLEKLPRLLEQERANINPAYVPAIQAETAIKQNPGVDSLIKQFIEPSLSKLKRDERERLKAAIASARAALAQHQAWLEKELLPKATGNFRLGRDLYDQKLKFALNSDLSRADIRRRAEAELARVRAEMYEIARGVLGNRKHAPSMPDAPDEAQQQAVIAAALELAYAERPARDKVVAAARRTLKEATDFVGKQGLVTLPPEPVEIILMPEFQRGVAVAYCDSPGPLDKHLKTFYAVSPIPDEWTKEQADSFLREYNSHMIHILSIHEGVPGHYLQLAHANRYPSVLRAVLQSSPFIEGWAVYTERVMTDAGYLGGDPLLKLNQRKFYLRAIANSILDQGIHVDGMTREQAMELMTVKTFQQEREAAGKWVRAQLTSAQLPVYFVGAQEHFDLRREAEQRAGASFELKAYHDQVLSFGSPPVKYVRALMFDEAIE